MIYLNDDDTIRTLKVNLFLRVHLNNSTFFFKFCILNKVTLTNRKLFYKNKNKKTLILV